MGTRWKFILSERYCRSIDNFSKQRRDELHKEAVSNPRPSMSKVRRLKNAIAEVDVFDQATMSIFGSPDPTILLQPIQIDKKDYHYIKVGSWCGYYLLNTAQYICAALCSFHGDANFDDVLACLERETEKLRSKIPEMNI